MKATDIRKKAAPELKKMLSELESELRELRFGSSGARSKNVKRSRAIRKDIARIKTIVTAQSHA